VKLKKATLSTSPAVTTTSPPTRIFPSNALTGPVGSTWAAAGEPAASSEARISRQTGRLKFNTLPGAERAEAPCSYDIRMTATRRAHLIFSLQQARELLPDVKHFTAEAVRRAESLAAQLHGLAEADPEYQTLSAALRDVVNGWADQIRSLGLEANGLWLVDFDNGEGYYCWCYPEAAITHYHAYDGGFAGRVTIQ
jgi:hypothetical protein